MKYQIEEQLYPGRWEKIFETDSITEAIATYDEIRNDSTYRLISVVKMKEEAVTF